MNLLRLILGRTGSPSQPSKTLTEDLTLFLCQRERCRRERDARRASIRRVRVGHETHILGGTSSGMSH